MGEGEVEFECQQKPYFTIRMYGTFRDYPYSMFDMHAGDKMDGNEGGAVPTKI